MATAAAGSTVGEAMVEAEVVATVEAGEEAISRGTTPNRPAQKRTAEMLTYCESHNLP